MILQFNSSSFGNKELCHANVLWFSAAALVIFVIICSIVLLLGRTASHFFCFLLSLCHFGLFQVLCDLIRALDDGKGQVEEEKRADKHHGHKEEECPRCESFLVHDHNVGPAFQSDALENIK